MKISKLLTLCASLTLGIILAPSTAKADIIMDNADSTGVTFTGSWTASTTVAGYYGSNYLYPTTTGSSVSATFSPNLPSAGQYEVFVRWVAYPNRATNAPIDVVDTTGTHTFHEDETINNGTWISLGVFTFNTGTGGNVKVYSTGANGTVIADAVKFVPMAEIIVDNADSTGVSLTGNWTASTTVAGYYGSNYLYPTTTGSSVSATFSPNLPFAGQYEVFVRWVAYPNRATNAPFDVVDTTGTHTFHEDETINNGTWISLGVFTFNTGTGGNVKVYSTGANGAVIADAVKFVSSTGSTGETWVNQDIGSVGLAGSTSYDAATGTFTVKGSGADIYGAADAFQFVQRSALLHGGGTITARVVSVQNTSSWAKAGVMIRETTGVDSKNIVAAITPGNGATLQQRLLTGGTTGQISVSGVAAPYWVRLTRAGDTLTGYRSSDGTTWTQLGIPQTISMATDVEVGLCVTSHNNASLCQAVFDNVSISEDPAFVGMSTLQRITYRLGLADTDPNTGPSHYLDIQQDPRLEAAAVGISPSSISPRVIPYTEPQPDINGSYGLTTFNSNYWSDSGNLGYISDGTLAGYTTATDNALRRVQNYAFYNGCIACQPMWDPYSSGSTTTDGTSRASYVKQANGGQEAIQPIATCRAQAATANGGVTVWANGLVTAISTQTGSGGSCSESATADVTLSLHQDVLIYRDPANMNQYRMRLPNAGETPTGYLDNDAAFRNQPVAAGSKGYVSVYGRTAYKLPATKIPRDICLTSYNELTLVSVYDTVAKVAQVAVFANQAKNNSPHNCPYLGMINEGSFSHFVFLGYVDLPIQDATYITAASNGRWASPGTTSGMDQAQWPIGRTYSCTAGEAIPANATVWITNGGYGATFHMYIPGSSAAVAAGWTSTSSIGGTCPTATASGASATINLSDAVLQSYYNLFTTGSWGLSGNKSMSEKGCCVVASRSEKKLVVIDLTPTIAFFKNAWVGLSTAPGTPATHNATVDAWDLGYGAAVWPGTFSDHPSMKPVIDSVIDLSADNLTPSAIRLGQKRSSISGGPTGQPDVDKLWVGTAEGTLVLYDVSKFMAWSNDSPGPSASVSELGRGFLGRNITHFSCTRVAVGDGLSIFPAGKGATGFNAAMYVTCRGERSVYVVASNGGQFAVARTYRDSRLSDPVAAWPATRGSHLCVCDYNGKQLVGFRTASVTDPSDATHASRGTWPIYDTTGDGYEIGGILPVNGNPFTYTCDNVN